MLFDTDIRYSASPRRKRKNWGHLQLMMSINRVYCIVLFVYLLRRGTRESMFSRVYLLRWCYCLAMCKKEVRVDGRMNSMVDRAICLLYYNY